MSCGLLLNLAASVYAHARLSPGRPALVVDERTYTYGQLGGAASRVGAWIASCNSCKPRARVGILCSRSFETYAGMLGATWAGASYVPLNVKMPAARMCSVLAQAQLDALIVDRRGAARLKELGDLTPANVLAAGDAAGTGANVTAWETLADIAPIDSPVEVEPDTPAYIIFTSGTTGVPKGVVVSVSNVAHYLLAMRSLYHLGPHDRVAQFFETTFDPSVFEMYACWDAGASLHVVPESKTIMPAGFIRQHEITVWLGVPSLVAMLQRLGQLQPNSFPSLRVSQFGGEGVPAALMQAWKEAAPNSVIDNQYGPTEATVGCLYQRLTDPPAVTPQRGTLAIGKPLPGMHAAIVDQGMSFLGANAIGELVVHGPQVAVGYLGDEARTAARFRELDHPTLGRTRWYLTGDCAYFDDDGRFHCLGRIDNQVKVMGHRVELEEIESHLRSVCQSESVAAVAWPMVNGNAAGIVAFVAGTRVQPPSVRDELRSRLPVYMVPSKVMPLEAMPLSSNGKVDRQALRTMLERESATVRKDASVAVEV